MGDALRWSAVLAWTKLLPNLKTQPHEATTFAHPIFNLLLKQQMLCLKKALNTRKSKRASLEPLQQEGSHANRLARVAPERLGNIGGKPGGHSRFATEVLAHYTHMSPLSGSEALGEALLLAFGGPRSTRSTPFAQQGRQLWTMKWST